MATITLTRTTEVSRLIGRQFDGDDGPFEIVWATHSLSTPGVSLSVATLRPIPRGIARSAYWLPYGATLRE